MSLAQGDECSIDGQTFKLGDNLGDAYPLRCGSSQEFPCFCNPDIERQADCPYCGFSAGDGTLHCAKDMETISFQDGSIVRVCSCEFPPDPSEGPIRSCTIPPASSPVDESSEGTCMFPNSESELVTFQDGESFGGLIEGICGPGNEWPSFCSAPPGGDGNDFLIDYPYCVFDDAADEDGIACAKDGEEITYTDVGGSTLTCSCSYSSEDGLQSTDCVEKITPAPVETTTPAPEAASVEEPTDGGGGDNNPQSEETPPSTEEDPAPKDDSGGSFLCIRLSLIATLLIQSSLWSAAE
jgi:hypothetical protein